MSNRDLLDEQIANVESAVAQFETENPALIELMEMLGITIDEYERIASGIAAPGFERSNSSA